MEKKQWLILVGIVIASISIGFIYTFVIKGKKSIDESAFNRIIPIQSQTIEWEFATDSTFQDAYTMYCSSLTLKPDNTLDFSLFFPKSPLVLETVLGSQLGREVFQIDWQQINTNDTLQFSGIDMSKFNPFEPFRFYFVYEYDAGYRARHIIEFEL
jgi:hypothetical protein